jgi:PAS domain S-box-containing protein
MNDVVVDLLENAPCGFVSFGDDGRIQYVNTTLLDRLGYRREELVGHHMETMLGMGSRIFYQTHFFPLVKLHGRAQEVFVLLRSRDGKDVGMLCNAVRRERDGAAVTDCVFMEVQERRKFEDALLDARQAAERANVALEVERARLERANALLEEQALELELQHQQLDEERGAAEEANHAKSNFLAVMSHELRTPLNAIGGYVQLLEMGVHGPVTPAQKEALGRIDRSQRHLLRLINDVLNLSRIEAGRVDYVVECVRLKEAVNSVMPMVEPQIASKGLKCESNVPDDLEASADHEKVQQILLNLLTNAIKFTAPGGSLRIEAGESDASRVYLRVTDSGTGIPGEMLEKVFEPFIQVDASKSRATEGTGLGLAISRDLARGMNGDLFAKSTLGVGSTFQLELPRY